MIHVPKTVLLLLGVILYLCVALVRVENQRYALWMGLCHGPYVDIQGQKRTHQREDINECCAACATHNRGGVRSATSGMHSSRPTLVRNRREPSPRHASTAPQGHENR